MAYTTIDNPELYFQVKTWTGDDTTSRAITLDGDTDMQPDLVWIKGRSLSVSHLLQDSVRGTGGSYTLKSDATAGDGTNTQGNVSAFSTNGFTVAEGSDADHTRAVNNGSATYVAWCWKESATAGFDIVTFTGSGGTQNISHSLSAKPELILNKSRSAIGNWYVYHGANTSAPETDFLQLQATDATSDNATLWNDTAPTTSVFTVGSAFDNTTTYVAYAFAPKQGYSAMGSYTGNGSTDGTFVYTGFRPAWVLIKQTNASPSSWRIFDNKRDTFNLTDTYLLTNSSNAESSSDSTLDMLSNGFKLRSTYGDTNGSGSTYIFMAFAEAPFVNSNGVPCNAR